MSIECNFLKEVLRCLFSALCMIWAGHCLLGLSLWLSLGSVQAQSVSAAADFPAAWMGDWSGVLYIHHPGTDSSMKVPMELRLHPLEAAGRWAWQLVYGLGEEQQVRAYELVAVAPEQGHYLIDEKNSILLDAYLLGGTLATQFVVGDSRLDTFYRLQGDTLVFEILVAEQEAARRSGGKGEVPRVRSHALRARHHAVLRRR